MHGPRPEARGTRPASDLRPTLPPPRPAPPRSGRSPRPDRRRGPLQVTRTRLSAFYRLSRLDFHFASSLSEDYKPAPLPRRRRSPLPRLGPPGEPGLRWARTSTSLSPRGPESSPPGGRRPAPGAHGAPATAQQGPHNNNTRGDRPHRPLLYPSGLHPRRRQSTRAEKVEGQSEGRGVPLDPDPRPTRASPLTLSRGTGEGEGGNVRARGQSARRVWGPLNRSRRGGEAPRVIGGGA